MKAKSTLIGPFFSYARKRRRERKNVSQICKLGCLKIGVSRISTTITDGEPNTKDTVKNHSPVYHHNCTSKYDKREIHSLRRKIQNGEDGPSTRERTASDRGVGSTQCCIFSKDDAGFELHATEMLQTKKSRPNSKHIRTLQISYVIWLPQFYHTK